MVAETPKTFSSIISRKTAINTAIPVGGAAIAGLLLKGEKNKTNRQLTMAAASGKMIFDSGKDALNFWKDGEYADFMMETLNMFLGTMSAVEGDPEPAVTAATMRLLKDVAHEQQHDIEDKFTAAKKERAKRIAGLPMIAHVHQQAEGHSHGEGEDHHDHDHGALYEKEEIIEEYSKLKMNAEEQEHMEGLLDHWRQFGAKRVEEAFDAYEKLANNSQRTAHDVALFEHYYGFIVLEGLKDASGKPREFDFHSQPFPQQGKKEALSKAPEKKSPDPQVAMPEWKLIAENYAAFKERFHCLYYDVRKAKRDIKRDADGKIISDLPKRDNNGKIVYESDEPQSIFCREIEEGDIIIVQAKQPIPVDGKLDKINGQELGKTSLDTSLYTGDRGADTETVIGDSLSQMASNGSDTLTMVASKKYKESSGFMLIHGDTKQKDNRASRQLWLKKMLDKYVKWIFAIGGVLFFKDAIKKGKEGTYFDMKTLFSRENMRKSMEFFIVAAPCQIAVTMLTIPALEQRLKDESKTYVLKRDHLVNAKDAEVMVFDLVGTLTDGKPTIEHMEAVGGDKNKLLAIAAGLESGQTHPVAHAIRSYATDEKLVPTEVQWVEGKNHYILADGTELRKGVYGKVEGRDTHIGNLDYFRTLFQEGAGGVTEAMIKQMASKVENYTGSSQQGGIKDAVIVYQAGSNKGKRAEWGVIGFQDKPRDKAASTVKALKAQGKEIVIATGSRQEKAQALLKAMGIEKDVKLHAGLELGTSNEDVLGTRHSLKEMSAKTDIIYHYIKSGKKVAMIGDGVNDGPAMDLVSAHQGCAMGMQSGDSGLIQDKAGIMIRDVSDVYRINELSKKLNKTLKWNVNFSIGWTGFLVALHLGEKKIKEWFGFELSTLVKGILHEGPTGVMAWKSGWKDAQDLVKVYNSIQVPEPALAR